LSKHIRAEELEIAIDRGDVPSKNVPGYDYRQICSLDLERWPVVKELRLESEGDVTQELLNGPVQQLLGVVKIVRIERQQHSPVRSDEPARHPPELGQAFDRSKKLRGTRGPPPKTTERVANAIKDDIRAGHLTIREGHLFEGSHPALQKNLRAKYKCGVGTLHDARAIALSEFETPTNSDKK
jgi:hypothetical protein